MRVYRYGLLRPTDGAELVREQMRMAHQYRCALLEIERDRRNAVRALDGGIRDLEIAAENAKDIESKLASVVKAGAKDKRDELVQARLVRRDAMAALREARQNLREEQKDALDAINLEFKARRLKARADASTRGGTAKNGQGLRHGTYQLVEDAVNAAIEDTPLYDGVTPRNPRFHRYTGEGSIGAQIRDGVPLAKLADGTMVRVAMPDPGAFDKSNPRGVRKRLQRTSMQLRVGSTDDRKPVWATWPMIMHRPMPEGSVIKRVNVHLRKFGPHEEWVADFVVDDSSEPRTGHGRGAVAVDLGWRALKGGSIRVARWASDDDTGEIAVPRETLEGMTRYETLQSLRDELFNEARNTLSRSMPANPPIWFAEATATLSQWRSPGRLAALALRWRKARFEGDSVAYDALEAWRYRDHHLWAWWGGQLRSSRRRRDEEYKVVAADLARRFHTLVLEKFNLSPLALRESTDNAASRANRQDVAPSKLRLALINAFRARGGQVVQLPPENTTKQCHACGSIEVWDQAARIKHTCSKCKTRWDQDDNAAQNLFAMWRTNSNLSGEGDGVLASEQPQEKLGARWSRAKAKAAERDARVAAARDRSHPGEEMPGNPGAE